MSTFMRPLARALAASAVTSGLGISVNIATELKGNLASWLTVAGLTVISGFLAALTVKADEDSPSTSSHELRFGMAAVGQGTRPGLRWGRERIVDNQGIVMRREIETRSDGTRIERVDYFNVELASRDLAPSPIPPQQAAATHEDPTPP